MGDRAFCRFDLIGLLRDRKVDSVMRLNQRRNAKIHWKGGRRIDADSRLVIWRKPAKKGKAGLSDEEWNALPETMNVRYVKVAVPGRDGKKVPIYLVTTLIDAGDYPTAEIALLYAERWRIEVNIRDIKTTMNFEMLRVKTPEMARKTIKIIQIAYNLVKARQAEAIRGEAIQLEEIGLKGTLDLINEKRSSFVGLLTSPRRAGD